ncbi:glycosyltransferase family 4 protein [uncultured Polaribacter sp.]|uniref:glycosyltransferase family 4 protein n=1 Tax=uncultured Polaribacter sp. TaxID=174711 RepID=UPI002602EDAF|nr:glycosyltransferase family 4 protein [uncultured Polaribacter sp.]
MSQKLSVLFLCGWYPSKVSPYNGDFIQRHAEAVSLGHNVSVIHIITDKSLRTKIKYTSQKINNINSYIGYIKPTRNPVFKAYLFFKAFKFLIKKVGKFDIVHLNEIFPFGIFSLYLKWLYKKRYIISEHWTGYHLPQNKNISNVEKILSKIIIKNASYICPVTNDLKNSLIDMGFKGKYHVVENVVDTKSFAPIKSNNQNFYILHISNMLDQHKNISGILNVVYKLQNSITNFKFTLIGENSKKYKPYAIKIGIDLNLIDFIDQIPHEDVINYIQRANLFVLFSNYENLPCVILESFSCGTPVISTDVGGIKEHFPDNFGKLINVRNENELFSEIKNVYLNNYKLASKTEMHKYVDDNFSKKVICEKFSNLYYNSLTF